MLPAEDPKRTLRSLLPPRPTWFPGVVQSPSGHCDLTPPPARFLPRSKAVKQHEAAAPLPTAPHCRVGHAQDPPHPPFVPLHRDFTPSALL